MSLVGRVLDVARSAIRLVRCNHLATGARISLTVVTPGTGGPRRRQIDRRARRVTTGTAQFTFFVCGQTRDRAHSIEVDRMKLSAAPLIVRLNSQPFELQSRFALFYFSRVQSGPTPVTVDNRITEDPAVRGRYPFAIKTSLVLIVMAFKT